MSSTQAHARAHAHTLTCKDHCTVNSLLGAGMDHCPNIIVGCGLTNTNFIQLKTPCYTEFIIITNDSKMDPHCNTIADSILW